VSQVARPADWIWAEYMTVASNAAFTRYEIVRTAPVRPWDEDGDGMADSWETEQFGATNAAGGGAQEDWDSDGMQNRAEYVAGTTATSGADRFTVAVERMAQGAVRMGFQTRPATGANYVGMSRHYALEDAAAFTGGFWMGVAGYTDVLATGEMLWYTNGTEEPSPAFYRGKVWLEE
jgi:hypothetical protein